MIISSFKYKNPTWQLEGITNLGPSNLIVGINAAGKSKTLKALMSAVSFMKTQHFMFTENKTFSVEFEFIYNLNEESHHLKYSFSVADFKIREEKLSISGKEIIKRSGERAFLNNEEIFPPADKLIVQSRRDEKVYPEIERVMKWAESVGFISFSDINPFTNAIAHNLNINPVSFSDIVSSFSLSEKNRFLQEARKLGYKISDISTVPVGDQKVTVIKENYIKKPVLEYDMSTGMIRVLYLLSFLIKVDFLKKFSLLLIDDLGEGLDYKRATDFGKKVFDTCEKENIQLIASSNDSCLMDVIPLAKWQLLTRNRNKVKSINATSNPNLFEDFYFTGLSNFDFFSSNFIDIYSSEEKK